MCKRYREGSFTCALQGRPAIGKMYSFYLYCMRKLQSQCLFIQYSKNCLQQMHCKLSMLPRIRESLQDFFPLLEQACPIDAESDRVNCGQQAH
jgi:hypothetical protein